MPGRGVLCPLRHGGSGDPQRGAAAHGGGDGVAAEPAPAAHREDVRRFPHKKNLTQKASTNFLSFTFDLDKELEGEGHRLMFKVGDIVEQWVLFQKNKRTINIADQEHGRTASYPQPVLRVPLQRDLLPLRLCRQQEL